MTQILLFENPFVVAQPREIEAPSLAQWLIDHYGDTPMVKVQVFIGDPSKESEITDNIAALMASNEPSYTILQSPGGFDPLTWMIIAAVALAVAVPREIAPVELAFRVEANTLVVFCCSVAVTPRIEIRPAGKS